MINLIHFTYIITALTDTPPLPPTRVLIKSRTDTIRDIQVENGLSQKLSDGSFSINLKRPYPYELTLTFIGHRNYTYHLVSRPAQMIGTIALKKFPRDLKQGIPRYRIDDIINYGELIGYDRRKNDSVFTISEFQLSIEIFTRLNEDSEDRYN